MTELPSGTVTFLFTDIEGSTRLLKQLRDAYGELLDDHRRLLRAAFEDAGGHEIDTQGDAFFVAFSRVKDALSAAVEGQRALAAHAWPQDVEVRVRMAIHTGEPTVGSERYVGLGLHRGARICGAAHGGQILLSDASRAVAEDDLPDGIDLRDLGLHDLKDFDRPERLFQLVASGLATDFPPPRTGQVSTAFEGREDELAEAAQAAVARPRLRRRVPLLAALAAVLTAAAGILVLVLGQSNGGGDVAVRPNSVAVIDPDTNDVVEAVEVGTSPSNVVIGEGAVWVLNGEDRTLSRIDPRAMDARTIGTGTTPTGLAVGAGFVWLVSGCPDITVFRLDPGSNHVELLTKLPSDCVAGAPSPSSIAYGADSLWVTNIDADAVWRIDAVKAKLEVTIPLPPGLSGASAGEGIAVGEGAVWVNRKDAVVRVDPATNSTATIEVPHEFGWIATGEGAVWTTDNFQGILWRVDPSRGSAVRSIQVGSGALGVGVGAGSVWVANSTAGTVSRVDPLENAIASTIELGGIPRGVAVGEGAVWVTVG
jgi:class 3 adenylate cyclase/streptogramin lyase